MGTAIRLRRIPRSFFGDSFSGKVKTFLSPDARFIAEGPAKSDHLRSGRYPLALRCCCASLEELLLDGDFHRQRDIHSAFPRGIQRQLVEQKVALRGVQ